MAQLALQGARGEDVAALARDLATGGPERIRQWLAGAFSFKPDPEGIELLRTPRVLLQDWDSTGEAAGDCDDAAILGASLAVASGYPVRFVVLGFDPHGPYGHVYAEAWNGSRWVDFDVTRPFQFPRGLRVHRRSIIPIAKGGRQWAT